jgi:microcystin-dependent protein
MIWPSDTAPTGWLICNGATFDTTLYAELRTVLGRATLPDLRNVFVRGANATLDKGFSHQQWTTGMPRNALTLDRQGDHKHTVQRATRGANADGSGSPEWTSVHIADSANPVFRSPGDVTMSDDGDHTHNVIGGDTETAPDHVLMNYIIKATPSTMLMD